MLMVKRSILSQKVVNCDGAVLECPCAAVDIFDIVNGVRTKQKSFNRRTNPCIQMKTFLAGMLFFF